MNIHQKPTPPTETTTTTAATAEEEQARLALKLVLSNFRVFLHLVWKHLRIPPGRLDREKGRTYAQPTDIQNDISQYLQHGPKRLIVEAFRGVGKSWITSALVCWFLLRNPQLAILVVSASKIRADDFSTFTHRLIHEMPLLSKLRPVGDQRFSKVAFDVGPATAKHAPSVKSVGITGQLSGSRADIIIADDIEVPNNSYTQTMRDKLAEAVKEFDAILTPAGRTIFLGTPQTEMTIYNTLSDRGYQIRIWPARYPSKEQMQIYGERIAPYIADKTQEEDINVGASTDPGRFTNEDLAERELSYGKSGFALQFMLDTRYSDADKYPLKLSDLLVTDCDKKMAPVKFVWSNEPNRKLEDSVICLGFTGDFYYRPLFTSEEVVEYQGSVLAIDPSGRGSDELAYAVVKLLNGNLFLTRSGGLQGGYVDENLKALCQIAKEEKVNEVIIEDNFGDGMFTALIQPHFHRVYPVSIQEVRNSKQKELRIIETLEPVMNQHRLIVDKKVIEDDWKTVQQYPGETKQQYSLFYQLTRITRERGAIRHDDRLDALELAVRYWWNVMAQDDENAIQERKDELLEEELERFMAHVVDKEAYGGSKAASWVEI